MTVNEFYRIDSENYECQRFYTTVIGNTIEDYERLTEEKIASKAYGAWCAGAR